ncbi:MAG TPA: glycosyltransferase family 1 protein [Ohtaekwangia sp.]|uniref:glycosyltransferase family 4 protein n=1 Tax=Ohtaekwangia sp. TaxID=2066019 RepID=UPI002F91DD05
MKVLLDHQIFAFQNYGGISRYFVEVADHLKHYPDIDLKCSVLFSNNEYLENNVAIKARPFFKNSNLKGKGTFIQKIDTAYSMLSILKNDYDIFHPTYYFPYHLGLNKKPLVVTCYDLIHEIYIQEDKSTLSMKEKVLKRADKIFAISKNTKKDLVEYYNIPEEKVEVVYLASSLQKVTTPYKIDSEGGKRFFLYVGKRNLYKNFVPFAEAIAPLLTKHKDLFLFCAGGGNFDSDELNLFRSLKIADRVQYYPGSDESLNTLYSNAMAYIYPSLYEGFGIPVLEAMGCGCPVLASNTSSLPEVGGDAALYFDPLKKDEIYQAAETILENENLRSNLKAKGLQRAAEFTWERTAQQSYLLYKNIV